MRTSSRPACAPFVALLILIASSNAANADVLVDNTYQPAFAFVSGILPGNWIAGRFQLGNSPARFDSVTLLESTTGNPLGTFSVSIHADQSGLPGELLTGGSLNGPPNPAGFTLQTYSAPQSLTLAPNTSYWIVAAALGSNSDYYIGSSPRGYYGWPATVDPAFTSTAGWTMAPNYAHSADQGASWFVLSDTGAPQIFSISGALVPEPGTLVLAALGSLGLIVARRRFGCSSCISKYFR